MYKAIIFDFFDVVHEDPQRVWLAQHGYKREGGFAEASDMLDLGRIDYHTYLRRYAELSGQTPEDVHKQFKKSTVNPEVKALIDRLRKQYKTGLLSNTTSEEIRPMLDNHQLTELFHEIIVSSEVGIKKPDVRIFHLALNKLQIRPEQAIFIDDNPDNVAAASSCGIAGVHFVDYPALCESLNTLGITEA